MPKALIKNYSLRAVLSAVLLVAFIVGFISTPHMGVATFSYGVLLIGLTFRKVDRKLHGQLMLSGVFLDLSLVLILEAQRSAINTAMEFSLTLPQQAHIAFSLLAVLMYIPAVIIGVGRYRGKITSPATRKAHKLIGLTAMTFRSLGFILMFTLLDK